MVINYREQDVAGEVRKIAPDGVDVIVEVAAAQNAGLDAQLIGQDGTVAVYADTGGDVLTVPIRPMMVRNARWQFVFTYNTPGLAKARAIDDVGAAAAQGGLRVGPEAGLPLHRYPLERAAEAQQAVQDGVSRQGPDHHQRQLTAVGPRPAAPAGPAAPAARSRSGQLLGAQVAVGVALADAPSCRTCRRLVFGTASMNAQRSGSCQRASVAGEELAQLVGGGASRPRWSDDRRQRALAPPLVGHADDAGLEHRRVGHQRVLQLDRADPLAAGLDDVLGPVGQREEAVGGERADVAGAQPAVVGTSPGRARRRRGSAPVIHGPRTSSSPTDLPSAGMTSPSGPTIRASTAGRHPALACSGSAHASSPLDAGRWPGDRAQRRHLGHPPGVDDLDAVPLLEGVHQRRRAGRAADDHLPQRGDVASGWRRGRRAGRSRSSAPRRRASACSAAIIAASGAACRNRSGMSSEAPDMNAA